MPYKRLHKKLHDCAEKTTGLVIYSGRDYMRGGVGMLIIDIILWLIFAALDSGKSSSKCTEEWRHEFLFYDDMYNNRGNDQRKY